MNFQDISFNVFKQFSEKFSTQRAMPTNRGSVEDWPLAGRRLLFVTSGHNTHRIRLKNNWDFWIKVGLNHADSTEEIQVILHINNIAPCSPLTLMENIAMIWMNMNLMNIATIDLNYTTIKLKVLQMFYILYISNYEDFCWTLSVFRVYVLVHIRRRHFIYLKDEVGSPLVYLLKMLGRYRISPTNLTLVKNII